MQKISPFLWFNDQAEEAANFYVSIFKNSAILGVSRYGEGAPRPAGSAMSVKFVLDGLEIQALNGGPEFTFTEAISLFVTAETQAEIDDLWQKDSNALLVAPLPKLGDKIALTAWGQWAECTHFNNKAFSKFISAFRYHAPESGVFPKSALAPGK